MHVATVLYSIQLVCYHLAQIWLSFAITNHLIMYSYQPATLKGDPALARLPKNGTEKILANFKRYILLGKINGCILYIIQHLMSVPAF